MNLCFKLFCKVPTLDPPPYVSASTELERHEQAFELQVGLHRECEYSGGWTGVGGRNSCISSRYPGYYIPIYGTVVSSKIGLVGL